MAMDGDSVLQDGFQKFLSVYQYLKRVSTMSIPRFSAALELLSREVAEDLQISTLRTLLFVGQRGECSQKDIAVHLKASQTSISRNVSYWTERRADRQAGIGYIERIIDEHDQRNRILRLTKRGQAFYAKLKDVIS